MRSPINDALARQRSGEPPSARDRNGNRKPRPRRAEIPEVERQIAELVDLSTHDLRAAWRQSHRAGPPPGLSRDLLIRTLVFRRVLMVNLVIGRSGRQPKHARASLGQRSAGPTNAPR